VRVSALRRFEAAIEVDEVVRSKRPNMSVAAGELTVHLERSLPAPRPLVFRMLTSPDLFARWWGPKGFTAPSVALDVRVGGEYRIAMQPPEGSGFFIVGEFRRVDAPARLSYTFRYEDPDPDDQETIVTLRLEERDESTGLMVDQGPFLTEPRRALHRQGWTEALDRLGDLVSNREQLGS
jgi:uncharacterized protein YndB with AHSA1/START domain